MMVTGAPLSSRIRSAATLFAPYPWRELKSTSLGSIVGWLSWSGPSNRGATCEFGWFPAAST